MTPATRAYSLTTTHGDHMGHTLGRAADGGTSRASLVPAATPHNLTSTSRLSKVINTRVAAMAHVRRLLVAAFRAAEDGALTEFDRVIMVDTDLARYYRGVPIWLTF